MTNSVPVCTNGLVFHIRVMSL
uniref:Uncharacterized protein n=1 Tax=Anguilla anguilla TaxID=7936 RepID=A0A0E9QD45_ANGAN